MRRVTVKGLLARKLRLALTALAIVLGVTFVTGTLVLGDTLNATFNDLIGTAYQHVSFEIRGRAVLGNTNAAAVDSTAYRRPVPQSIAAAVSRLPGVAYVHGAVVGYAQFMTRQGNAIGSGGGSTLGFSFDHNRQLSPYRLVHGRAPTSADDVVMDKATATKYHFAVGDRVLINLPNRPQTFTIAGIVTFGSDNNLAGITLAGVTQPAIVLVGLGALAAFVAAAMLLPIVARPLSSALGRPLAVLLGTPGKLGRENSIRNPRRTTQTAAALMIGIALVSAIAVLGASFSTSAKDNVESAISADYIVSGEGGFSQSVVPAVSRLPGVTLWTAPATTLTSFALGDLALYGEAMRPRRPHVPDTGAGRSVARLAAAPATLGDSVIRLQRRVGNRAVGALLGRASAATAQRKVGWSDAVQDGYAWNADERQVGKIRRIPLEDLPVGLPTDVPIGSLTTERSDRRAIVLLPGALDARQDVEYVVFLHGHTGASSTRPYAGWRAYKPPPPKGPPPPPKKPGKESDLEKWRHGIDAHDVAPVRDVALDEAEKQLEESGLTQLVIVLPQGALTSQFGDAGDKNFDAG
jgi:hypothetical protein